METILEGLKVAALELREAQETHRLATLALTSAKDKFNAAVKDCGIDAE